MVKFEPRRIKTLQLVNKKFDTIDNVTYLCDKFDENRSSGEHVKYMLRLLTTIL